MALDRNVERPGGGLYVSPIVKADKAYVAAQQGVEVEEPDEEVSQEGYLALLNEFAPPVTEEVGQTEQERALPTTPIQQEETVAAAEDEPDISFEAYQGLFQESLIGMPEQEQAEILKDVTPDEDGLSPAQYRELLGEVEPKDTLKINLNGLTVDSVFENNPEWIESLKPGPDGLTYAADVAKGMMLGIREGLISGGQWVAENLYGVDPKTMYVGEVDFDTETKAGEITTDISRFLTSYAIWGAPLGGVGGMLGMSSATSRYVIDGVVRGSATDFLAANKDDQTLIGLLAPESDNLIVQSLRVDPEDSEMSAKMAVAMEGALFGTLIQGALDVGRWGYSAVRGGQLKSILDTEFRLSDDLFDPKLDFRLSDQAERNTLQVQQSVPTGQQLMDTIQSKQANAVVDEKMRILEQKKEVHAIKEAHLDFRQREQVRTQEKNFINVAEKDLKKIETRIDTTRKEIEELVRRQEGLWEQTGGIRGIIGEVKAERELDEIIEAERKAMKPGEVFEPVPRDVPPETLLPQRPGVTEADWSNVYRNFTDQIQRKEAQLKDLLDQYEVTTTNILESKYLIKEIADEVQLDAAVRKGLATKLDLTPRYSQIKLEDEVPLAFKATDDALKEMRNKYKVAGKFTLLNTEGSKFRRVPTNDPRTAASKLAGKDVPDAPRGRTVETRPQPSTPNDALVDDLFYKRRGTAMPDKWLNKLRGLGSGIMYRSTDKLRSLAEVSPTAGKLANMLRHDAVHMGPEAGQYGYTESAQYMIGKYRTKLRDVYAGLDDQHKTYFGKLTEDANRHIYNYLNGIDLDTVPSDLKAAGKKIREVLDDFHGQVKEDTPSAYVENFFPRHYNRRALTKQEQQFRDLLAQDGYVDKVRQDAILKKIVNEMDADLNIGGIVTGEKQFAMRGSKILSGGRRTLELNTKNYSDFLDTDVTRVLDEYIERGSPKVVYNQLFGYGGEKVRAMLGQIAKEAEEAGRPIRPDETAAIAKMLQNIQGLRKFDTKAFNVANESIATAMRVTLLHLATLSSLGEVFIPFSKANAKDSLQGLLTAAAAIPKHYFSKVLKNVPESRAYEAAQAVGLATDYASSTRINNILGGGEIMTGVNRKVNNVFFLTNLLSEWVKFVQVSAFHTGRVKAVNNLKAIAKYGMDGPITRNRGKELKEMGISIDEGLAWLERGASQKDPFYEQIQRGALRFVDDTIIHPDATVKPGIQNSPEAMLLTQLKAYPTGFANIVLRDWGEGIFRPWMNIARDLKAGELTQETLAAEAFSSASKAARVATASTLMFMATATGVELKDMIKWGLDGNPEAPAKEPEQRFLDVLDTAGMLGHLAAVKHAFDADRYNQDPLYSWIGPAPGTALKLVGGAVGEMGGQEGALQDAAAKEAANLTRMPLPFEVMWSLATPGGTEDWRRNFRDWMSSPEITPEEYEPFEIIPDFIRPYVDDWEPLGFVRDWYYPDKTREELFEDDEEREVKTLLQRYRDEEETPEELRARARELFLKRMKEGKIKVRRSAEDGEQ